MDSRISTKTGERMNKALVTSVTDTGLVKLDWLNNYVVIYNSRSPHTRMVPVHVYIFFKIQVK